MVSLVFFVCLLLIAVGDRSTVVCEG